MPLATLVWKIVSKAEQKYVYVHNVLLKTSMETKLGLITSLERLTQYNIANYNTIFFLQPCP